MERPIAASRLRDAFEWGVTREGRIQVLLTGLSFLAGLAALLFGAWYLDYPDWDVGISLVMAFTTLATARWSIGVFWKGQWRLMPLAVFFPWLSVDGVYWAYWSLVRPEVMIREGQWMASLCLYLLCGVIWYRLVPLMAHTMASAIEFKTKDGHKS